MTDVEQVDRTLEPCPFCGGGAKLWKAFPLSETPWCIDIEHVGDCFMVHADQMCRRTEADAIAAWNARHHAEATAALTAERDALVARVAKLDRVARFARHTVSCGLYNEGDECTCGLDAARKALHDPT